MCCTRLFFPSNTIACTCVPVHDIRDITHPISWSHHIVREWHSVALMCRKWDAGFSMFTFAATSGSAAVPHFLGTTWRRARQTMQPYAVKSSQAGFPRVLSGKGGSCSMFGLTFHDKQFVCNLCLLIFTYLLYILAHFKPDFTWFFSSVI